MAVCTRCARLADENSYQKELENTYVEHQPSIYSLVDSSQSCDLCQFFLGLCPQSQLEKAKRDANTGLRTRCCIRSIKGSRSVQRVVRTTTIQKFYIVSPSIQFESRLFAVALRCMSYAWWSHVYHYLLMSQAFLNSTLPY